MTCFLTGTMHGKQIPGLVPAIFMQYFLGSSKILLSVKNLYLKMNRTSMVFMDVICYNNRNKALCPVKYSVAAEIMQKRGQIYEDE